MDLGIWFATTPNIAQRFGQHCLEVEANIAQAYDMPIAELRDLNTSCLRIAREMEDDEAELFEREFYKEKRNALIAQGYDFINLAESDGRSDIGIGLVPERLVIL